jgi:hypothetical protein
MKKFIIGFEYKGFSFSAKVLLYKSGGSILYSIVVGQSSLDHLFEERPLAFIQEGNGFLLLLLRDDNGYDILTWQIRTEFADETQMPYRKAFSLS